jgi:ATP-dependent phosphoenolpyruvate carboxykinase
MATIMHVSDVAELLSEGRTHFNLSAALLVEHSIRHNEAKLASNGAIVGYTNRTGRSPGDVHREGRNDRAHGGGAR